MLAEKIRTAAGETDPWPHVVIDDFLPASVFEELRVYAVGRGWTTGNKTRDLPAVVVALLNEAEVEKAIQRRFGFVGGLNWQMELTFRMAAIARHSDRADKLWSGILYIAGDEIGTELYQDTRLAKTVEFRPNRLLCWGHQGEQHAVPKSRGRYAIQWWILQ